jgi:sugar phosphate isomerase/epimerase
MKLNNPRSRRSFLGTTATVVAGLSLTGSAVFGSPNYIPNLFNPNSSRNGVRLGVISYSFRELADQSAEAILQYIKECGVNGVELMGETAESFLGSPRNKIGLGTLDNKVFRVLSRKKKITEEERNQLADLILQKESYDKEYERWRKKVSIADYAKLRKMYNDAGVSIYAFKPNYLLSKENSDSNINYAMQVGKILGASHVTLELPRKSEHSLKLGQLAEKNGIYIAYHGHEQQNPTWWDTALSQSPNNAINLDLGHYVAAGNPDPIGLIKDKQQHILSMHIKDRKNPANGKKNMPFGRGDTPVKEALQLMRDQKYTFPATIEYEYKTPAGSTIINEIKKSIVYCKDALES